MKHLLIYGFFTIFVTTFSQNIFAWDDSGHKLTAYIAWERMTPKARETAIKLFMNAPEDSQIMALYPTPVDADYSTYSIGTRSKLSKQRDFFMVMAYWADIVRERKYPNRNKFSRSNWHYLNTFWREVNGKIEIVKELKADKENVVERLFHFDKVLRDSAVSDADKAVGLAWVLHLAGDVHQPLHASGRVTETEPKGDQGANLFTISPKDAKRREDLHWYWDSIVAQSVVRKDDASDAEYLLPIAKAMMKKYPFSKMESRLKLGQFDQWQDESFRIAASKLYPKTLKRNELPSEAYKKMAFLIAEEQIALSGYRMGEMLNQIFDQKPELASDGKTPCKIIRKVRYPITQTNPSETQTVEIGLLNLCPPNKGMMARPMYSIMKDGKIIEFEYDIDRIFKTEKEAREYAEKNSISDISIN